MTGKASVRDVAQAAGVSVGSVSRVLNGNGYASQELRGRVLAAAKALDYEPSFAARHLRTGRSRTVGYLTTDISNPLLAAHFSEVEQHMHAAGYSMLIGTTRNQHHRDRLLVELFETRRLEGIIASLSMESSDPAEDLFAKADLPIVIMDRETASPRDCVLIDHRTGLSLAVRYLKQLGHRRIAFFGPKESIRPGREKLLGYQEGLAEAGLAFDPALVCTLPSMDSSRAAMKQMLALKQPPTAVIALGTRLLSGALYEARKAGLEVPHDLSVIALGTPETLELMYPPPTMLRFNTALSAETAANLMLDRLEGHYAGEARRVVIPMDLMLGESCAPVRPGR
ncbi:MAG: LacI family DNA-binding transcriptional regulator [Pseudomonadota bacterium]